MKSNDDLDECIFRSHVFEPRYSETTSPDVQSMKEVIDKVCEKNYCGPADVSSFTIHKKIYECDVCVRCGKIVKNR